MWKGWGRRTEDILTRSVNILKGNIGVKVRQQRHAEISDQAWIQADTERKQERMRVKK
jgi:hypothetical protein